MPEPRTIVYSNKGRRDTVTVPAGATDDDINRAISAKVAASEPKPPEEPPKPTAESGPVTALKRLMNEYDFGLSNAAEGAERWGTGKAPSFSEGMKQVKEQEEINNRAHPWWASAGTVGGVALGSSMGPAKSYVEGMSRLAPELEALTPSIKTAVKKFINAGTQAAGYETLQNVGNEGKVGNPIAPFLLGGATYTVGEKIADALDKSIGTVAERFSPKLGQIYRDLGGAAPAVEGVKTQVDPRSSTPIKTVAQRTGFNLKNPADVAALKAKLATPGTTLADVFDPAAVKKVFGAAMGTTKGAAAVRDARQAYADRAAAAAAPPTPPPAPTPTASPKGILVNNKGKPLNTPIPTDTYSHALTDNQPAQKLLGPIRQQATDAYDVARAYGTPPKGMPHHQLPDDPLTLAQHDQLNQALQARAAKMPPGPAKDEAQALADKHGAQLKIDAKEAGIPDYGDLVDARAADADALAAHGNILDQLKAQKPVIPSSPIPENLTPPPKPDLNLNLFHPLGVARSAANVAMAGARANQAAAAVPVLTSQDLSVTMKAIDALAKGGETAPATALAQKLATQASLDVTAVQNQPPHDGGVSVTSAQPATPAELAAPTQEVYQ